jgi:hypothetical protein
LFISHLLSIQSLIYNNKVSKFSLLLIDNTNRFELQSKCNVAIRLDPLPLHQVYRQSQFLLCPGIYLYLYHIHIISSISYEHIYLYLSVYLSGLCQVIPIINLQIDYLRSIYFPITIEDAYNNNDNITSNVTDYESLDIALTCSLTSFMVINSYKKNINPNKQIDKEKNGKYLLIKLFKEVFWRRIMECKNFIFICIYIYIYHLSLSMYLSIYLSFYLSINNLYLSMYQ